ncbi:membrane protein insertion efficiency factor YidD [bacterium]|nr:membrane protein insertion efficiency factor YidD [bacterium]
MLRRIVPLFLILMFGVSFADSTGVDISEKGKGNNSNNTIKIVSKGLLEFYQKYITDLDAHRCPMEPSCSEFSKLAFKKTGPLRALLLTSDRLMRDNSLSQKEYKKNEEGKKIDPIERYIECVSSRQSP